MDLSNVPYSDFGEFCYDPGKYTILPARRSDDFEENLKIAVNGLIQEAHKRGMAVYLIGTKDPAGTKKREAVVVYQIDYAVNANSLYL